MSIWLWTLEVLAGAGLAGAIAGLAMAVTGLVRLRRRLAALRESPFVTKIESLQIQLARLTRLSGETGDLRRRAEAAVQSLRDAPEVLGVSDLRGAWNQCAAQIRAMVQELS